MFVIYLFVKNPFIGEYHIIEFNENNKISEEDYNELYDILNNKYVIENIKIHKIASEVDFRHEGSYYIFFESSSFDNQKSDNLDYQKSQELYKKTINDKVYEIYDKDGKISERVLYHISLNTMFDEEYKKVKKICLKYYKFWENNEKKVSLPKYVYE